MTIVQALEPSPTAWTTCARNGRKEVSLGVVEADPVAREYRTSSLAVVIVPSAVEAPTTVTTVRRTVIVEQPFHFDDIDANHRDAYGRDEVERSPAPRMIVQ